MAKQKTAIIIGVTGQDGSYLADYLIELGYKVIGLKRRTSIICTDRIDHLMGNPNFVLDYYSLHDSGCTYRLIQQYQPDEVYNLAAQSHVAVSFLTPQETIKTIVDGCLNWLEAIRILNPQIKFYQASSSEMFGRNINVPLSEASEMLPASPYGCAKLCAHHLVQNYRESYGLFACSGILFNHESPRRSETFVTRKVTRAIAKIARGDQDHVLVVGNLEAKRDWGFAKDFVEAMHLMLQAPEPDDYVVSTGDTYTVREWITETLRVSGIDFEWRGNEVWSGERLLVKTDPKYERPQEVPLLLGCSDKIKNKLNWENKTDFKKLVEIMYNADYSAVNGE